MSEEKDSNSYRNILKGTSLFGGVQIFQILINLLRGKFVALFLGPEGMGISSMFTSASNTIQKFASLGLNLAIVKEIAAEKEENRENIIRLSSKLIEFTSIIGALICAIFAKPLSQLTFGNESYFWQFIVLSISIFLLIQSTGKLSILQGLHRTKEIARGTIIGSLTGLIIGVPLYYFFHDKGIVPAIVILSLALFLSYSIPLRDIFPSQKKISWREQTDNIKRLILLGVVLMANDLLSTFSAYLINIYIRVNGSESIIGLYQAATSITNQYSGMVFAALAMDYFPRLSKAAADNPKMNSIVNRQTEIVALIIAPASTLLILTTPLAIRILLTPDFLLIIDLMRWMGLGILIRALSFPLAYVSFAKGNKKLFFWMEGVGANILTLLLSCLFFHYFGLIGLGYAFVADNAICLLTYYIINCKLYKYQFTFSSFLFLLTASFLGLSCFIASYFPNEIFSYGTMCLVFILSLFWSFYYIRKKINIPS